MDYKQLSKRIGKFYISEHFFINSPELVIQILSNMIILKAEHFKQAFEYYAYSENFDLVDVGGEIPCYVAECLQQPNDGSVRINWIRSCAQC